jgi:hypothetical protein
LQALLSELLPVHELDAKINRNFEVFTPTDFLPAITQHIPDKGAQIWVVQQQDLPHPRRLNILQLGDEYFASRRVEWTWEAGALNAGAAAS